MNDFAKLREMGIDVISYIVKEYPEATQKEIMMMLLMLIESLTEVIQENKELKIVFPPNDTKH